MSKKTSLEYKVSFNLDREMMGRIVDLGGMCTPLRDDRTGIVTVEFKGALYELVRLLSDREVVKDDQPS